MMPQLTTRQDWLEFFSIASIEGSAVILCRASCYGHSSQPDVQSHVLLNLLIKACRGVTLLTPRPKHLDRQKGFLAGFLCAILLAARYLAPISGQIVNF